MEIGPQNNLPWEQDTAESFGSEKLRPAADLKSLDEILPRQSLGYRHGIRHAGHLGDAAHSGGIAEKR